MLPHNAWMYVVARKLIAFAEDLFKQIFAFNLLLSETEPICVPLSSLNSEQGH